MDRVDLAIERRAIEVRYSQDLLDTSGNPAHAATWIRRRLIVLDAELQGNPDEHKRILTHELYHFVWARLGNPRRKSWEELMRAEALARARGDAGWSAEWRKRELTAADRQCRTRKWREYCCEAFCDTAAWLETGTRTEVTLAQCHLKFRRRWFAEQFTDSLPI